LSDTGQQSNKQHRAEVSENGGVERKRKEKQGGRVLIGFQGGEVKGLLPQKGGEHRVMLFWGKKKEKDSKDGSEQGVPCNKHKGKVADIKGKENTQRKQTKETHRCSRGSTNKKGKGGGGKSNRKKKGRKKKPRVIRGCK